MVVLVTADVGLGVVADELRRGDASLARGSRRTTALPSGRTTARSPRPPQTWALHRPSISVRATLRLENRDVLMTVLAFPPYLACDTWVTATPVRGCWRVCVRERVRERERVCVCLCVGGYVHVTGAQKF